MENKITEMANMIFELKDKISDGEFKKLMELNKELYDNNNETYTKMVEVYIRYHVMTLCIASNEDGEIKIIEDDKNNNISYKINYEDNLDSGIITCEMKLKEERLWLKLTEIDYHKTNLDHLLLNKEDYDLMTGGLRQSSALLPLKVIKNGSPMEVYARVTDIKTIID